jgi:hypothetical protein
MSGIDPKTIMELGGWKDLTMVMRYTHLSTDHKREAVERIAKNSTTVFTTVGFDAQQMKGAKSNSINRVGR